MAVLGPDFRAGLRHALYQPHNPIGLWRAVGIFVVLLLVNQLLLVPLFQKVIIALTPGEFGDESEQLRAILLSILPAGLVTVYIAWILARQRGADPSAVLALKIPALGILGWVLAVAGFYLAITMSFYLLALLFGLDLSPRGLVEQSAMQFSQDPRYLLVAAGLIIGAPFAEEVIFRGQIFAALSQTPLGVGGASLLTSALWAIIHGFTQPLPIVGLLFVMGLALCWLLVRFGSLWVTIACHAAWNAMSAFFLYLMAQP
jgi:membrane protease YdiL (CAAX protease family)